MLRKRVVCLTGLLVVLGLLALPRPALAEAQLRLAPASGPRGTTIDIRVTGVAANTTYVVQLVRGTGNVNTVRLAETTATSDAGGQFRTTLTVDQPPGTYTVRLVTVGGTIVAGASDTFTVTAGTTPQLPNTGGGLAAGGDRGSGGAARATGALALALAVAGLSVWRRRRA